jgi:hypothetical protein
MIPYLLLAHGRNTALAACLVFSDRVLDPSFRVLARRCGPEDRRSEFNFLPSFDASTIAVPV